MKINFIQTAIASAIAFLIAYAFYSLQVNDNQMLLSIGSFTLLAIALVLSIGVRFEQPRTTTNIRFVSGGFFTVALGSNVVFSILTFSLPVYVIVNGILLLGYLLIIYLLSKSEQ